MIKQANPRHGTREELEVKLRRAYSGKPIYYLGMLGPDRGDDHWPVHAWRIGNPVKPAPVSGSASPGGKQPKTDNAIYRREVWTGSGEPVGPVDFSRPADKPEQEPFPAPEITSHDPLTAPAPGPIAKLALYAQAHGWTTEITYSRGCIPHATHGRPSTPKDLWAVRLRRGDQRAAAVQHSGGWRSLWTWSPRQIMTRSRLFAEFETVLTEEF